MVFAGRYYCKKYGDLCIFSYGYLPKWNAYERVCRGLIINQITGEIVARPFDKFFNWFEGGRKASGHIVNITEKLDGSLGILYRDNGYKIATRSSFTGKQALWATEFLNRNYELTGLNDVWTLLFEIIYPDNRIVVNYGDREDLVLLAARNRFTGEYLPYWPDVFELGELYGFSLPTIYNFNSVSDILGATGKVDANCEGWVVEFSDGSRWKFKGDEYLEVHKLISGITPKRIIDALAEGKFNTVMDRLPEEYKTEINVLKAEIMQYFSKIMQQIEKYYELAPRHTTRKDFALWVQKQVPKEYQHILFAWEDDKDVIPLVWESVRKTFIQSSDIIDEKC